MHTDTDIGVLINPDLDALFPSPTNPRKTFDDAGLVELAHSIRANGVMQPIVVRELTAEQRQRMGTELPLEIVAGERRYRASIKAGLHTIPAVLRSLTDEQVIRLQITENLQRVGLSPLEEAEGYEQLRAQGLTAGEIGIDVGKSKAYIYAKLKLLALTDVCRDHLRHGDMSEAVALLIARFPAALQGRAMSRACQPDLDGERPSYRAAQRILRESFMIRLDSRTLRFNPDDAGIEPGSCTTCQNRMGTDPECEPELADVCTDTACYARKTAAGISTRQAPQQAAEDAHDSTIAPVNAPAAADDIANDVAAAEASFAPAPVPAPASTPPATTQAATRRNDLTAPLRKAWADYRDAVAEQIVSNPPLFVAGPLLREVAYQLSQDTNYHLDTDASNADAMTVILRIVTEHLARYSMGSRSRVSLEDIAGMVGIDHARILQETIPVPDGCARPNENGVYPTQETLSKAVGKSSLEIRIARTGDGWRTSHTITSNTSCTTSGISIYSEAQATRQAAIKTEVHKLIGGSQLDNIPNKDRWALCSWLESITTEEAAQ